MTEIHPGVRVRELREASGMTQEELGLRLGLRKDQVSKAEKGVRRFDVAELAAAAQTFGTTVRRLLGQREAGTLALAARISADAGGTEIAKVVDRARQLLELDHLLDQLEVGRTATVTPEAQEVLAYARNLPAAATKRAANADGEALAEQVRQLLGLGTAPLSDIADLAERHFAVDVECGPFGEGVSGMCVHGEGVALILANTDLTLGHLRFTAAHELGHHLLGDPRDYFIEDQLGGDSVIERRANAFAAHLLMPRTELVRLVAGRPISDEVLGECMQYFQVSLGSLVPHLADCGLLPFDEQSRWAGRPARWLISQYGDPGRPDPTVKPQTGHTPARLLSAARTAQREGRIGSTIVAALLGPSAPPAPVETDEAPVDTARVLAAFADL